MEYSATDTKEKDHCRIGSLERFTFMLPRERHDHCRIGSLENYQGGFLAVENDHCRIGSLEILVHICD